MLANGELKHVFIDTLATFAPKLDRKAISAAARISTAVRRDNIDLGRTIFYRRPDNHLSVLGPVIQSRRLMVNRFATASRAARTVTDPKSVIGSRLSTTTAMEDSTYFIAHFIARSGRRNYKILK